MVRHIIPISGKDSLATALVQMARESHDYEFVFNDVGAELPETYEWLDRVESYLGKPLVRVGKDLKGLIASYNYFLPSGRARYCTRQAKIEPFVEWLGDSDAVVYYGIRADEERHGFDNSAYPHIVPKYPLQEVGFDLQAVILLLEQKGLRPPVFFWERLYEAVQSRLSVDIRGNIPSYIFDMLFAGRSRGNCFFCFYQRVYELVWLLDVHPDLFLEMESYEERDSEKPYHWRHGYPCKKIREKFDYYFEKRVRQVVKWIKGYLSGAQLSMYEDRGFVDDLQVKSCGLFCGK